MIPLEIRFWAHKSIDYTRDRGQYRCRWGTINGYLYENTWHALTTLSMAIYTKTRGTHSPQSDLTVW